MEGSREQDTEEAAGDTEGVASDHSTPSTSTGEQPPEPGRGDVFHEPVRLLHRNPQLVKVILMVSFQMAAADIAGTIDLGPDTNQYWQENTTSLEAMFNLAAGIMSYTTGPIFGRFTDAVDRRIAMVVYGFITFLPTFVYWFYFPLDGRPIVWATHYASIIAAIGRSSNVEFALSMDVTAFEDRALAAGIYYGLTNFGMVLLSVLPAFIIQFCDPFGLRTWLGKKDYHPMAILVYQAALVVAFVASAFWIAKPEKRGAEDESYNDASNANAVQETTSCRWIYMWVDMLKLVRTHERLRRLMIAAFFLAMSLTISTGNDGQFFCQSLLEWTDSALKFNQLNVLRSVGAALVFMPGYFLAGYVSMKSGTLKVLRWLVPLTAVLMALGALTVKIAKMWFVPIVVAVQYLGDLYQGPLLRLAAGVARPGHIGVWLTLVGMAAEVGSMLGNTVIIAVETPLKGKDNHLWMYYPSAGLIALLALIPLLGRPRQAMGWGAAAGSCREQFDAMMAARKAGRHWRHQTSRRRGANGNPESSSKAPRASASAEGMPAEDGSDRDTDADSASSNVDATERREHNGAGLAVV